MSVVRPPVVTVHLQTDWAASSFANDVRAGLSAQPRRLSPKWLYDDRGSELFDQITRLPEYYLTEAEQGILRDSSSEIASLSVATTLIELGSGTSDKTRTLLDAFTATGQLERFVAVDISEATLRGAAFDIAASYPGLAVEAVVGDFTQHLDRLPRGGRRVVAFLGSTIGNFYADERAEFLAALFATLEPGDSVLLGTDLVKDTGRLIAAYNDSAGVTSAFVTNCLAVMNRELGADFDLDAFSYVAQWDPALERMDLRLRVDKAQQVRIPGAGLDIGLAAGDEIQVEISAKFQLAALPALFTDAGFAHARTWTDPRADFALTLAFR